jgi:hypothetical protein
MKVLAAGALLFVALEPATIARADDASALDAAIADHFRRVPSEGVRYDGVTVYGETLSGARIRDEDRQAEIALYRRASKAAAMTNPDLLTWRPRNLSAFHSSG